LMPVQRAELGRYRRVTYSLLWDIRLMEISA